MKIKAFFKLFLFVYLSLSISTASADIILSVPKKEGIHNPKIQSVLGQLVKEHSSRGREGARNFSRKRLLPVKGDMVKVVLVLEPGKTIGQGILKTMGVRVIGRYRHLLEVEVPIDKIEQIANEVAEVKRVRLSHKARPLEVKSEGVLLTGASDFHNLNFTGSCIKIAVIDMGFGGLGDSQASGDLPYSVIFSTFDGFAVDISSHGTACAEIVYDMAPDAELHLLRIYDDIQLGNAKDYCKINNIDIISCSLGWICSGPGDGTGVVCGIADDARNAGILWVNSAGNQANRHWQGDSQVFYSGALSNGTTDWDVLDPIVNIAVTSGDIIELELRWNTTSWNYCDQNYDLFLFDSDGWVADSTEIQVGAGFSPNESITHVASTTDEYTIYICNCMGLAEDTFIELHSINHDFEESSTCNPAGSIVEPADSEKVLTVGAIHYDNWVSSGPIEDFSSQGPTKNNRIKPDMCGPDGVTSDVYGPGGFWGTSASAPHVAGAAALILSMFPDYSADDIESKLFTNAIDCGVEGIDNIYGFGELNLLPGDVPRNLLCEGEVNPENIINRTPEFSWAFSNQSAYRVIVASSFEVIHSDTGDMWDYYELSSSSYTFYAGSSLSGNCTYYWKVRCWDVGLTTSSYSITQRFSVRNSTPFAPTNTTYYFQVEIEPDTLEFSWTFSDPDYVDGQSAYQILVSSAVTKINSNTGDFWDSGKVMSSESTSIPYGGNALEFGTTYYWKARTWDVKGATGPYCSAQIFETTDRPTNFEGVALSTYSIMWSWQDNCRKGTCSYVVYDGTINKSGILSQSATSWIEGEPPQAGLDSNTQYTRRVLLSDVPEPKYSNSDSRYTMAKIPTGLTVLETGDHSVNLRWVPEGGSYFGIARATFPAVEAFAWLSTGVPRGIDTHVTYVDNKAVFARTTYWYTIKGYNGDGVHTSTTTAIIALTKSDTTPPGPPIVTLNNPGDQNGVKTGDTIVVTGMSVGNEPELTIDSIVIMDQTGYELYRSGNSSSLFDVNIDIDWNYGTIEGTIEIKDDIKNGHRTATHLILEVTVMDNDNGYTAKSFSTNSITILGEEVRLNVYIPYEEGKRSINPIIGEDATIFFEVMETCPVEVSVYTIAGELVKTIVSPEEPEYDSGCYIRTWNGRNDYSNSIVANGIYLIYCNVGGRRIIKKVAVVKE